MKPWFAKRRIGVGYGPISWEGWLVTLAYVAANMALAKFFGTNPAVLFPAIAILLLVLLAIVVRTAH